MNDETREERRLRRENRLLALCLTIIAIWILCLALSVDAGAAYDGETYKTALATVGAMTVSAGLMRAVVWLDTPKRKPKRKK